MLQTTTDAPRIFISAGDPSGDKHAARLMAELRLLLPGVLFEGIGGPAMEMQGLRSMARLDDLAVTGFWEVAKRYAFFRNLLHRCTRELLRKQRYALFIAVDYPGFNLRLARRIRSSGIRTAWYIAPQTWAWGKERTKTLAAVVDRLFVVFPFEEKFFADNGVNATFVGHPLLDDPAFALVSTHDSRLLAFLPGSRAQEVQRHASLLAATAKEIRRAAADVTFACAIRPGLGSALYTPLEEADVELVHGASSLLRDAGAGMVKAGTSTLEAALLGLPFATFYKTSAPTFALSKYLVNVASVTMMNLLLERNVAHELLQGAATPKALAHEALSLLDNVQRRAEMLNASLEVRALLGSGGAAVRTAGHIAEMLSR